MRGRSSGQLISIIVLACFGLVTTAAAQIAGGLNETTNARHGGNNYIVGTVFGPSGIPINIRMRICLSSLTNGDIVSSTDDAGRFVFSGIGSGQYTVIIDSEKDFETINQQVDVTRRRSAVPETYTVMIRLRERATNTRKPGVFDASDAGVPKRAMEFYHKAAGFSAVKDYRAAIEQLKLAVVEYPKFLNAYNEMSGQYLRLNELENADQALVAALKIKPDAYQVLVNRGIVLFRLKRFKEAEGTLRSALRVVKESSIGRYYLGRTLHKLDRSLESEKELLASASAAPGAFSECHRLLAVIYLERGATAKLVEQLETYLRLVPHAPDALELGQLLAQSKVQK